MTSQELPTGMIRATAKAGPHEGYMPGFGNDFETEALPDALPQGMNSPQKCNYGLYGEQLSGTAFTANPPERTWTYRIRPSVKHSARYTKIDLPYWKSAPCVDPDVISLGQYRWDPVEMPGGTDSRSSREAVAPLNWLTGMRTMTTAGDVNTQVGMASHIYLVTESMVDSYFFSADSELLVVPQQGRLRFCTELGVIDLAPQEIAILPRGLVYRVEVLEGPCRGFVCENYGQKFELPGRGPIGANCLANPRDFKAPVAAFEDREVPSTLTIKWCGQFHETRIGQSPLDVVAWHGNYAPYKYDLRTYCPVGAILFDHPDPSIFTVLTAPSGVPGTANIDFVLFRERWMVAEDTFRPPWYHKNIMSELMGNIYGQYDAKPQGFVPGGMSLHNMMLPHGPDRNAFEGASNAELKAEKLDNTMSFMFETRFPQHLTAFAAQEAPLQDDYIDCWESLEKKFDGTPGRK
ncbi:homogentisate 1,2-dioxygenase [Tropicibacter naphthalenivorans]|uniref:Homogentisate 1,2-dioxygenase n=1 Tax=Tropicibacter naphthalenivorans TaxID=441103 RepID=A0A0N7M0S0_9RHOB|nr:homogentisate 1,2-dioxygenase [Tropicibacter naphthalenivorans]CUH81241.1 Homogentisate 1,2-dioxygenase [Tropicibacter naphthalenivorans]SMC97880.1 homogentisate 1,2-dioxygenase [Tropicibacter naphthalenivorans]